MTDAAQTEAVKTRKAPATIMKEKIEAQAAELARLQEERDAALALLDEAGSAPAQAEPDAPARSRSNTEGRKRRARGSNDLSHQMKLGVGFDLDPNFEYRWINNGLDNQRLYDKTRPDQQGGDWIPLTSDGTEVSDATGTALRRAVGPNGADGVEYATLCCKPKDLYEEDQGLVQAVNDKRMQAIYEGRGAAPGETAANDGLGYQQETDLKGAGRKAIKL